jgi:hypothetical protein
VLLGIGKRVLDGHDAKLLVVFAYDADFFVSDLLVDLYL